MGLHFGGRIRQRAGFAFIGFLKRFFMCLWFFFFFFWVYVFFNTVLIWKIMGASEVIDLQFL